MSVMLSKKEFIDVIHAEFIKVVGDVYTVERMVVSKNNCTEKVGLVFKSKESEGVSTAPVFYIGDYYARYTSGALVSDIVKVVLDELNLTFKSRTVRNTKFLLDFEEVKDKIIMSVVSKDRNLKMLEELPHIDYLNLAIIFSILVDRYDGGIYTAKINKSLLKTWDVEEEGLLSLAINNSVNLFPPSLFMLDDVIISTIDEKDPVDLLSVKTELMCNMSSMFMLTNSVRIEGASTILYPGLLKQVADMLNSDLIVFPSSIHEILITRFDESFDISELKAIVKDVNKSAVRDEDILSSTPYLYRRATNDLAII